MSIYGYKKKTKPALWTTVPGRRGLGAFNPSPRKKEEREYAKEARLFIDEERRKGKTCPVLAAFPGLLLMNEGTGQWLKQVDQVHHVRGRRGPLLRDKRFWLAVSSKGHRWIHDHPSEARERGWLCAVGEWNKQV